MMNSSGSTPPPSSSTGVNGDKVSGQLIIKAQLGDDIRKMMIHNEDLTLNELVLMMERVFAGKISNSDEITIKYLDDDGDKITLLNDSDLTVALHFHKLLRLFVFVNGQEQVNADPKDSADKDGSLIDAKSFRTELQQIRTSIQAILDRLQSPVNGHDKEAPVTTVPSAAAVSSTTREFDPFKNMQQQRSATPDSIRSKSSNSNHEQKAFQPTGHAQAVESHEAHMPPASSAFQPAQMPTPHFVPSGTFGNDQQAKINAFGPPPTSFPGMPPLPNAGASRFPTGFSPAVTPSGGPPSAFSSAPTPPPQTIAQPATFIGQQQQQQQQQQVPPQQGGFYGQQQALFQQRPPVPSYNSGNTNNAFSQQAPPAPPSSSSPATINPSFAQPPPMASQQQYAAYPPQNSYYNPVQQYPKAI